MHLFDAGWSSLVARRAHNPKAVGSNPAPATTFQKRPNMKMLGLFLFSPHVKTPCLETRYSECNYFCEG